jgi:hypothetical protein
VSKFHVAIHAKRRFILKFSRRHLLIFISAFLFSVSLRLYFGYQVTEFIEAVLFPLTVELAITVAALGIYHKRFQVPNDESERFALTNQELIEKYRGEALLRYKNVEYPISVTVAPRSPVTVDKIKSNICRGVYRLPGELVNAYEGILGMHQHVYNGVTLRLNNVESIGNQTSLSFQISNYFSSLVTNNSPDVTVGKFSIRETLEPGPFLAPLDAARASNHMGVALLVLSADGELLIPRRGDTVASCQNQYSPTASGVFGLDVAYCPVARSISIERALIKELDEEVAPELELTEIYFLGLTRDLRRTGAPEAFFVSKSRLSKIEIRDRINEVKRGESISQNENKSFHFKCITDCLSMIGEKESSPPLTTALILLSHQLNRLPILKSLST